MIKKLFLRLMFKQAQIYLLVLLVGFQSFGIFVAYPIIEGTYKLAFHQRNVHEKHQTIRVQSLSDLAWHNASEVYIQGIVCDVIRLHADESNFIIEYIADHHESEFFKHFEEIGAKVNKIIQLLMKGMMSVGYDVLRPFVLFQITKYAVASDKMWLFGMDASDICNRHIDSPPPQWV